MFTLDQVAFVLAVEPRSIDKYVRFMELGKGQRRLKNDQRMRAVRITPTEFHEEAEWRVPERELVRWMRAKGLVIYERKLRL